MRKIRQKFEDCVGMSEGVVGVDFAIHFMGKKTTKAVVYLMPLGPPMR